MNNINNNNMNTALDTFVAHLDSHAPKVERLLNQPLAGLRRSLADRNKKNPVTFVAERLAGPEVVEAYLAEEIGGPIQKAGEQFLASIHDDIDNQDINEVRRQFVSSNQTDGYLGIKLAYLGQKEMDEQDERRADKKAIASALGSQRALIRGILLLNVSV